MRYAIIIFFFLAAHSAIYSQDLDEERITVGAGYGIANVSYKLETGRGPAFMLGYKKNIWTDRLHINPNLLLTACREMHAYDSDNSYNFFNSYSFRLAFAYDIAISDKLFITLESGPAVNYTRGTLYDDYTVRKWNAGLLVAGGFTLAPKESKFSLRLVPINAHFDLNRRTEVNQYLEIHALLIIECKI